MARDAIGLVGIDMIDEGIKLPTPRTAQIEKDTDDILNYVDVDFEVAQDFLAELPEKGVLRMGNIDKGENFERYIFRFDTACNSDSFYHCTVQKKINIKITVHPCKVTVIF